MADAPRVPAPKHTSHTNAGYTRRRKTRAGVERKEKKEKEFDPARARWYTLRADANSDDD